MNTSPERIGILLTRGCISETASPAGMPCPPDAEGMQNVQAASYALKHGIVDRVIVVGKLGDAHGQPLEEGHAIALRSYLEPAGLEDRVEIIPSPDESKHTLADLRWVMADLKRHERDQRITVISCAGQLSPKTKMAMRILGYPHAQFLSAEFLMADLSQRVQAGPYATDEPVPVSQFHTGKMVEFYEDVFTAVSLLDMLPGNINLGTRILDLLAGQSTLRKLRSKLLS